MKANLNIKPVWFFYFFLAGIFLMVISPNLLSHGMFMDGLIYSSVAKNLAEGMGSFWNPHFSDTFLQSFHEHPPLAFGIQSVFFRLFGESRFVEKFYSIFMVLIVAIFLVKIWKIQHKSHAWFPLLLWLSVPVVGWACCNNMLENTLSVFVISSVFFYLKSLNYRQHLFLFLSGFMLVLGFLTKGFIAFFPWTFPLILWLLVKKKSFSASILDTTELILFTAVPLILLIYFVPEAKQSLKAYLDVQVLKSLKSVVTVDTRFFIMIRLLTELIPIFILCFLFFVWGKIKKFQFQELKNNYKQALVFIFLGLSGVLPVMISMKQSGFYILASYPLFAIGISLLLYPILDKLFGKINFHSTGFRIYKYISVIIFFTGIILAVCFSNGYGREKTKIKDLYVLFSQVPSGSIINVEPDLFEDWGLQAYFSRFKNISLDPDLKNKREYLLVKKDYPDTTIVKNYETKPLCLTGYKLLELK